MIPDPSRGAALEPPAFYPEYAASLGDELLVRGLERTETGIAWYGPSGYGTELSPLVITKLGPHLYNGTLGIALFLAALARVSRQERFRVVSLKSIARLRQKLRDLSGTPDQAERLRIPSGGLIGLGSFLYGFLLIGELLDDDTLVGEAHRAAALLTPEVIGRDRQLRVQTGVAGAILALLALHARRPDRTSNGATPLDLARRCASHLAERRVETSAGPRAWPLSPGKPPVTGFSYGAAGVSYALLRLYEATGEQPWRDLAREGWSFVRAHYAPEQGNWRDARHVFESRHRPRRGTWADWWAAGTLDDLEPISEAPPDSDRFLAIWCHGAVGIALARLAALDIEDGPEIRQEILATVERLEGYALETGDLAPIADDLCCGHAGMIELLVEADRILGRPSSLTAARALWARVRSRADAAGGFRLSAARGRDFFAPTLFQGLAGLGYTLLRLGRPDSLPCLLRLEGPTVCRGGSPCGRERKPGRAAGLVKRDRLRRPSVSDAR